MRHVVMIHSTQKDDNQRTFQENILLKPSISYRDRQTNNWVGLKICTSVPLQKVPWPNLDYHHKVSVHNTKVFKGAK